MRMRRKQHSTLYQVRALEGAKTTLGSTMCSCSRRGCWIRLEGGLRPNLQLDKGGVPPIHTEWCLAMLQLEFCCESRQTSTANSPVLCG